MHIKRESKILVNYDIQKPKPILNTRNGREVEFLLSPQSLTSKLCPHNCNERLHRKRRYIVIVECYSLNRIYMECDLFFMDPHYIALSCFTAKVMKPLSLTFGPKIIQERMIEAVFFGAFACDILILEINIAIKLRIAPHSAILR